MEDNLAEEHVRANSQILLQSSIIDAGPINWLQGLGPETWSDVNPMN